MRTNSSAVKSKFRNKDKIEQGPVLSEYIKLGRPHYILDPMKMTYSVGLVYRVVQEHWKK